MLFSFAHQLALVLRNDHVVKPDRQARARGVAEAQLLDAIQHLHGAFQPIAQIAIVDELPNALLLQKTIDEGEALGKVIVQDRAPDGGVHVLPLKLHRLRVNNVLIVVRLRQVNDLTCVTQANRRQRFQLAGIERQHYFFAVGEDAALALRARLALRQVVQAKHHVLRGHGDRLA